MNGDSIYKCQLPVKPTWGGDTNCTCMYKIASFVVSGNLGVQLCLGKSCCLFVVPFFTEVFIGSIKSNKKMPSLVPNKFCDTLSALRPHLEHVSDIVSRAISIVWEMHGGHSLKVL